MTRRLSNCLIILAILLQSGGVTALGQTLADAGAVSATPEMSRPAHVLQQDEQTGIAHDSGRVAMMEHHDHGAADCDDYCMNCSSHCFVFVPGNACQSFPSVPVRSGSPVLGELSDHRDQPLRPPIQA